LDIFGDFLYVLRLDKWGYIRYNPAKKDLTKKKLFDMGFGNWVGLNCDITALLIKKFHTPLSSIFLHKTHKIILSVIYYCG